ncbi:MAG TPA: hypothetical protein VFF78_04530, partial [Anaerolineaceae bacterium]|nr:hypothetical protein [Anaerolineaceae bacterium]
MIKNLSRYLLILIILALGVMTLSACSSSGDDDTQVIFGGSYNLPQGKTLRGSLVLFGGNARLEPESTVMGDVVIIGGTLSAAGTVKGDVTSVGGTLNIESSAILEQDLNTMGGSLANLGTVRGTVYESSDQFSVEFVRNMNLPMVSPDPATQAMWILLRSLILAGLALLVILLLPHPTDRVAQSISRSPLVSGGAGCLTLLFYPAALIVLAITIILIPITFLGLLLLGVVMLFGWIGLGLAVGKALANAFHLELPAAISGGLGTLLISLVVDFAMFGLGFYWILVCCAGIPFLMVVFSIAVGGVLLSQFGTKVYSYTPSQP